jgi:hypothetical protein
MSVILTLRSQSREDHKFEASLGYVAKPYVKKQNIKNKKQSKKTNNSKIPQRKKKYRRKAIQTIGMLKGFLPP